MAKKYSVGELIYDSNIYDGMNTDMTDLSFYKQWLPANKEAKILELCCGSGRLTIPIAKEGYDITGVDITSSMLKKAKEKASNLNLGIKFIEADIRTLELKEKFDFIFIPFNSIHHLYQNDDLFNTLNCVQNHLNENGLFLLDCFNPNIQLITDYENHLREIANYTTSDGRQVKIKQSMLYHSKNQINHIKWHYYINGKFDSIQNLDMRMYFPLELDAYLKWNGFDIKHKFGGFKEEQFLDNSEKQIFVCKLIP